MFPFQSHSGFQTWSNQQGFVQEQNWVALTKVEDSIMSSTSKVDNKKQTEACRSHKEAERRRRQRINAHLSTLRTLLPNTTKTDKASLLAEVVHHVKELRRQAADMARLDGNSCSSSGGGGSSGTESWPFPEETDELILTYCDSEERLMKATLCCEDRPGLNRDISRAIGSVQARLVRAEMMTVGDRTKSVLVMEWSGGAGAGAGAGDKEVLRRALNDVVENRASVYGLGRALDVSKRPRIGGVLGEGLDEDVLVTSL